MIVCTICSWHICRLICINMKVTVTYNHAAILKAARRLLARRIAKLMHNLRRINKVICVASLSNRRSLKKCVTLIWRILAVLTSRHNNFRCCLHSQHIFIKDCHHRAASRLIPNSAKTCVQIGLIFLCDYTWIKLWLICFFFTKTRAIRIMNIS